MSHCLFEDQAFKFDWRRTLVGKPEAARLWETQQGESALVVRTGHSVLASLDSDSGSVRWRHVLEQGEDILVSNALLWSCYSAMFPNTVNYYFQKKPTLTFISLFFKDLSVNERTVATVSYVPYSSGVSSGKDDEEDEPVPPQHTVRSHNCRICFPKNVLIVIQIPI